jgi:hypothetical protein
MEGIEANEREELLAEDLMVPLNGVLCEGEAQHIIDRDLWNTTASNLSDLHCTAEEPAGPYKRNIPIRGTSWALRNKGRAWVRRRNASIRKLLLVATHVKHCMRKVLEQFHCYNHAWPSSRVVCHECGQHPFRKRFHEGSGISTTT